MKRLQGISIFVIQYGTRGGTCHGSCDGRRQLTAEERLPSQAQSMRDLRWKKSGTGTGFSVSVSLPTILTPSFTSHQRYAISAIESDAGSYVTNVDSYSEHPGFKSLPGDRGSFAHSLNANSWTAPSNSYHHLAADRTTVLITLSHTFLTRVD